MLYGLTGNVMLEPPLHIGEGRNLALANGCGPCGVRKCGLSIQKKIGAQVPPSPLV